jgi:hypothetical protein
MSFTGQRALASSPVLVEPWIEIAACAHHHQVQLEHADPDFKRLEKL